MASAKVGAVLFAKDSQRMADFYRDALGLSCTRSDEAHAVLDCRGFELIVHQIPRQIAEQITIAQPPQRRVWGAIRLDYPLRNLDESRRRARLLGGGIDEASPAWAGADSKFFLGYDPEGNQFGITEAGDAS